jgi:cytochrome b6-f complex iron-sulfur subunit
VLFSEQKIKCPCHGSGFRFNGINFEGPTPRPLERYAVSVDPIDGQIVVDKTKKFQYEKGQWDAKESYIEL